MRLPTGHPAVVRHPCSYCDVLPYDDNRVRLGRPAFPPGWVSGSAAAASAAPAVNGSGTSPARGSGCGSSSSSGRGSGSAAEAGLGDLEDYVNASPLYSCDDGSGGCFGDERWAYIASQVHDWEVRISHMAAGPVPLARWGLQPAC